MSNEFDLNFGDDQPEKPPSVLSKIWGGIKSMIFWLPRKLRIVLAIIGIAVLAIGLLVQFKPEAKKRAIPDTIVKVDVVETSRSSYPIIVNTSGTIQADTRGNLVSQIRGEIVKVSDKFKTGGAFDKGDVLIQLDQRDYIADSSRAAAAVSQAQVTYSQEQANAKQATSDWKRLGNAGNPPALVARKPQLAAAKAQLDSAQASYQTAQLNLERTNITAPYTGRVIRRDAVLGQYVGVGTVLAEVFATDGVEARLPLSQSEYSQLGLDSLNTNSDSAAQAAQFSVSLNTQLGSNRYSWDAAVSRTDSLFDLSTRQIDVIATVIDPFGDTPANANKPPLKIGQFVNATIQGRTIDDIIVIPNQAIREGNYVFASVDKKLVRKPVAIAWQDDQNALIESGLEVGDLVVTTSLNSTLAGAKVKFSNDQADDKSSSANPAKTEVDESVDSEALITEQAALEAVPDETSISDETPDSDQASVEKPESNQATTNGGAPSSQ